MSCGSPADTGPDDAGHVDCALSDVDVVLMAAVLGLRGAHVQPQPLITDTMAFAWNGEVFDTPDAELAAAAERGNDGAAVWERLCAAAAHEPLEEALVRVLGIVEGPYAFVLVHVREVWCATDAARHGPRLLRP